VAADPDPYTDDDGDGVDLPASSRRSAKANGALKTLLDQLADNPQPKAARRPRRRFKRGAGAARLAGTAGKAPDRAAAALSLNSSSQEAVCGNKYLFRDGDELRQHVPQDSRNVNDVWDLDDVHGTRSSLIAASSRSD
jgi:hypothetical protein